MDVLNQITSLVIILLLLSLVTEKLTQLVRKYPDIFKWILLPHYIFWLRNLIWRKRKKVQWLKEAITPELARDDNRETKKKEISVLAVFVGMVVATIFNADLIELIKSDAPYELLDFGRIDWEDEWYSKLFGFSLTGLFLSFGSQLFHDLLDFLYFAKGIKRAAKDKDLYDLQNIKDFDEYIKLSQAEMAQRVRDEFEDSFLAISGVLAVGIGTSVGNPQKMALKVFTDSSFNSKLPSSVPYLKPGGKVELMPVEPAFEEKIRACAKVGAGIYNGPQETNIGTLGSFVKLADEDQFYFLTCYHCVKPPQRSWALFISKGGDDEKVYQKSGKLLGHLAQGSRTLSNDSALVEVSDPELMKKLKLDVQTAEKKPFELTYLHLRFDPTISFTGSTSPKEKEGHALEGDLTCKIEYADGYHILKGLIAIAKKSGNKWTAIAEEGDSGAIVLNKQKHVVGMVVATGDSRSYMLPVAKLLDSYPIEFI